MILRSGARSASTRATAAPPAPVLPFAPARPFRLAPPRALRLPRRGFSSQAQPNANQNKPPTGFSARIKELTKKYGWAALGVYLGVSVIDFGLAYGLIHVVGAEHVQAAERWAFDLVGYKGKSTRDEQEEAAEAEGVDKKKGGAEMSIWTTAALAYGIHKTLFLPVRVGITAAVTPRIVKELQRRGFKVGPRTREMVRDRVDDIKERLQRRKDD